MWMPESEQQILAAIEAGDLVETDIFDAKAALPSKGKSKDLAIDVAAMATNGGTLLYGVGEDENHRLTVPQPFRLPGARERVDQIVHTSISEPPDVQVREIPTKDDPGIGYLIVAVPPSPRAPHMVTVGKEYRYYGRSATGNVPLTEGEVARLYERRQRWEVDLNDMLDEAIASAPIEPYEGYAFLHLVARPVVPDDLLDRAKGDQHIADFLYGLFSAAMNAEVFPSNFVPDLPMSKSYDRRADGWAASSGISEEWRESRGPKDVLDFEVRLDGGGQLFCGRAAEEYNGRLLIFEHIVAGLTSRFLYVLGGLYAEGGYLGPVDVGLAVTSLRDGISSTVSNWIGVKLEPFDKDEYRRTERFPAATLTDKPRDAARKLVLPLVRAITRERYDPFSDNTL